MREIKFRGQALSNDKHAGIRSGDFVYGSFIKTDIDAPAIVWGDGEQMGVDIQTVGQFTGLTDKSGVEIYEGDILSEPVSPVGGKDGGYLYKGREIKWLGAGAGYRLFCPSASSKVIGNKYQNPELLKDNEL